MEKIWNDLKRKNTNEAFFFSYKWNMYSFHTHAHTLNVHRENIIIYKKRRERKEMRQLG